MAINFKKGPALSLGQADKVAQLAASQTVIAGQVVRVDATTGNAYLGVSGSPSTDLVGFSLNNYSTSTGLGDGDAISTNSVGIFLIDAGSVVEVDGSCTDSSINSTNYPVGTPVYATSAGLISTTSSGGKLVGQVEGIRNLPNTSAGAAIGTTTPFLGIKLIAA